MAAQVTIQLDVDEDLQREVSKIYESLGIDLHTALRMFLIRSKIERGLPFSARLSESDFARIESWNAFKELQRQSSDVPEMSIEEINDEISAARSERRNRK